MHLPIIIIHFQLMIVFASGMRSFPVSVVLHVNLSMHRASGRFFSTIVKCELNEPCLNYDILYVTVKKVVYPGM